MPQVIANAIERLVTTEMRPGAGNMPRGYINTLHQATLKYNDNVAPTYTAAKAFIEAITTNEQIVITTGAGMAPQWPNGEIDGLLGSAALAYIACALGNTNVTLTIEERILEPLKLTLKGAGLNPATTIQPGRPWSVVVKAMPIEDDRGEFAKTLFKENPAKLGCVISVEKAGPNQKGFIHYSTGIECGDDHAKGHYLTDIGKQLGAHTIGIGDGGNEIGFGNIQEASAQTMPNGLKCQCPCQAGAATVSKTDELLVGAVSNWAAYGLTAMTAYLAKRTDLTPTPTQIYHMFEGAIAGGAVDGLSAAPIMQDDGIPLKVHQALATMLHNIVKTGLTTYQSIGH